MVPQSIRLIGLLLPSRLSNIRPVLLHLCTKGRFDTGFGVSLRTPPLQAWKGVKGHYFVEVREEVGHTGCTGEREAAAAGDEEKGGVRRTWMLRR
jgi:hypothetical protein